MLALGKYGLCIDGSCRCPIGFELTTSTSADTTDAPETSTCTMTRAFVLAPKVLLLSSVIGIIVTLSCMRKLLYGTRKITPSAQSPLGTVPGSLAPVTSLLRLKPVGKLVKLASPRSVVRSQKSSDMKNSKAGGDNTEPSAENTRRAPELTHKVGGENTEPSADNTRRAPELARGNTSPERVARKLTHKVSVLTRELLLRKRQKMGKKKKSPYIRYTKAMLIVHGGACIDSLLIIGGIIETARVSAIVLSLTAMAGSHIVILAQTWVNVLPQSILVQWQQTHRNTQSSTCCNIDIVNVYLNIRRVLNAYGNHLMAVNAGLYLAGAIAYYFNYYYVYNVFNFFGKVSAAIPICMCVTVAASVTRSVFKSIQKENKGTGTGIVVSQRGGASASPDLCSVMIRKTSSALLLTITAYMWVGMLIYREVMFERTDDSILLLEYDRANMVPLTFLQLTIACLTWQSRKET